MSCALCRTFPPQCAGAALGLFCLVGLALRRACLVLEPALRLVRDEVVL